MKSILVSAVSLALAAGCGAADPVDSSTSPQVTDRDGSKPISSSSGSSGSQANPGSSSSSSSGDVGSRACSERSGFWTGPLEGMYVDLLDPTNVAKKQPVLGTVTIKIAAAADGKISVATDSKIKITLKKILPGGGDATLDKAFSGAGTCDQLDGESGGDTGLVKVDVKATCRFSQTTCPGTWTATSGGKPVADGTFSVTKQQ